MPRPTGQIPRLALVEINFSNNIKFNALPTNFPLQVKGHQFLVCGVKPEPGWQSSRHRKKNTLSKRCKTLCVWKNPANSKLLPHSALHPDLSKRQRKKHRTTQEETVKPHMSQKARIQVSAESSLKKSPVHRSPSAARYDKHSVTIELQPPSRLSRFSLNLFLFLVKLNLSYSWTPRTIITSSFQTPKKRHQPWPIRSQTTQRNSQAPQQQPNNPKCCFPSISGSIIEQLFLFGILFCFFWINSQLGFFFFLHQTLHKTPNTL